MDGSNACQCRITTKPYEYQPLGRSTIRLLRPLPCSTPENIHCTVFHRKKYTRATVPFKALSYCWGDDENPKTILLDGSTFHVRNNLWLALSALVKHHNGISQDIWIDSICINQDDLEEKTKQVSQMWRVYSGAKTVIAWLGPEAEDTAAIFQCLHQVNDSEASDRGKKPKTRPPRDGPAIQCACSHGEIETQYFRRTWIISEYLQAKSLVFLSGRYTFDREAYSPPGYAVEARPHLPCSLASLEEDRRFWAKFSAEAISMIHESVGNMIKFRMILRNYSGTSCTDPRDRIFAALAHPGYRFIDRDINLKADYSLELPELVFFVVEHLDRLESSTSSPSLGLTPATIHAQVVELVVCLLDLLGIGRPHGEAMSKEAGRMCLLNYLSGFQGPTILVLRSGRRVNCLNIVMWTFVRWVLTGMEPQYQVPRELQAISHEDYWRPALSSILFTPGDPQLQISEQQWAWFQSEFLGAPDIKRPRFSYEAYLTNENGYDAEHLHLDLWAATMEFLKAEEFGGLDLEEKSSRSTSPKAPHQAVRTINKGRHGSE